MAVSTLVADRFELLSEAGKGAMGSVHRARDRKTGNQVAVKILILERDLDIGRFGREATLLSQLHHPNIVGYVSHGTTADGRHYLAQEWVDGLTLRTQLKTLGVSAPEAVAMARGIADALAAAHAIGVLHRDVKPENLILGGGDPEHIKLVDFGIARTTDAAARLTRTGVMIGTPAYMSPEQARGESQLAPAVDVWAVGCVLYEMLSGRTPYSGQTPMAIRAKVLFDLHPALGPLCPEAPPALIDLVEHMLEKNLAQRLPTGAAVAAALRGLPPTPAGPRRRTSAADPSTTIVPRPLRAEDKQAVNVFVFFNSCEVAETPSDTVTDHSGVVAKAAARHGLAVHMLEDGSAVLAAQARGRGAAVDATRAALELQQSIPSAAVSVVGSQEGGMAAALERGGLALERSAMQSLFGEIVGDAGAAVHVDQVIAELVGDDVTVEQDEHGPVVRANR